MRIGPLPPTITVESAGRLPGVSRSAAYRSAARGDLPTIRLAGRLHVPTAKLLDLLGLQDLVRIETPGGNR